MDPITSEVLKIGISETAKLIFSKVLSKPWIDEYKNGKSIVEQLTSLDVHSDYIIKHVSRAMKMRTIHSSEHDVILSNIYHPLTIANEKSEIRVGDNFLMSNNEITNIIGFAGQGKSTILRKILLEAIKNGDKIPFFMELRKVERLGIEQSLLKILNELGVHANEEKLASLLKSDNVVLLLDGFDEVSSEMRKAVLEEINHLNKNYNVQIISTSRDGTEICTEPGVTNYRVNRIKRSDIISILKKLSQSNEVEQDTLAQIFKMLKGNDTLVETMNSPLLVTLFYICYPHLDSIPNSAIEFYSKLFTTLYFRHDKIKNYKRERKSNIGPSEAFEAFCALCFKSLYDNRQDFTHHSIIEYAKQSLSLCGIENCQPQDMAYDFIDITCLIQKDGYDRYVFLHKSIQEYHAAEYVKSLSLDKKKIFMEAILNSIKIESKMTATARYLYEIDKENAFNLLCAPLCEEYKIDKYKEDEESFLNELYDKLIIKLKFSFHEKPEEIYFNGDEAKEKRMMAPSRRISAFGPIGEIMKPLSIFTRYYNCGNSNPYNDALLHEIINEGYIEDIHRGNYTIHENDDNEDDELITKANTYYVLASDVIEKLKRKKIILSKIREITDNIYMDAFMNNKSLIERKDDALKEILGF